MENHPFNLEERTFIFARNTGCFLKTIKPDFINKQYITQLVRSSASIGANYIEATEYSGVKDRLIRLRISRKEGKESAYWLRLLNAVYNFDGECLILQQEAQELKLIFSKIIEKLKADKDQYSALLRSIGVTVEMEART